MKVILLSYILVFSSFAFGMTGKSQIPLRLFFTMDSPKPTQFLFGRAGVENRKRKFLKLLKKPGALQKYLNKKAIPFILRKDGKRFIIDRHHFSRALFELQTELREISNEVLITFKKIEIKDLVSEDLTLLQFERSMKENSLVYLVKSDGKLGTFSELPIDIMSMNEDFYRGLAWLVRKSGAYEKTNLPYLEFFWADYLKKELKLNTTQEVTTKTIVLKAIRASIVSNIYNSILPGFIKRDFQNPQEISEGIDHHYQKLIGLGLMPK